MIKINNLTKSFDKTKVLDNLDLKVNTGSIYGLVGINGSGKTTIIKHLTGVYRQDSGEVLINDLPVFDNEAIKSRVCFVPDELNYFSSFTLKSAALYYSRLFPGWSWERYQSTLSSFNLSDNKKLSRFSKGMQKQAALTLALSAQGDYLILDEPLDGLDPLARRKAMNFVVEDVAERNLSVLISSHNLKELEGICDAVGIIHGGRMMVERDLDELKSDIHKIQVAFDYRSAHRDFSGLNILRREKIGSVEWMVIRDKREKIEAVIKGMEPLLFDLIPLTLEEIFMYEVEAQPFSDENKVVLHTNGGQNE